MIHLAAFVVIVAGMKASAAIMVPFLLSAFIAIIASPLMFWLKRKGVSDSLALGLMIVGLVIGILLYICILLVSEYPML